MRDVCPRMNCTRNMYSMQKNKRGLRAHRKQCASLEWSRDCCANYVQCLESGRYNASTLIVEGRLQCSNRLQWRCLSAPAYSYGPRRRPQPRSQPGAERCRERRRLKRPSIGAIAITTVATIITIIDGSSACSPSVFTLRRSTASMAPATTRRAGIIATIITADTIITGIARSVTCAASLSRTEGGAACSYLLVATGQQAQRIEGDQQRRPLAH